MTNEQALMNWADDIGNIDTSTEAGKIEQENQEAQFELLMDQIDAYKTEYKLIKDCENAANGYMKQVEEVTKQARESVVEMEDKFIELFIKRDEEALENLEERYDKMKEMDDEYLDSVRDAIDEERRLRDQSKAYDDVAQMERKLAMLQMGGGSAVEIQKLQEDIKQARQDIADTEQDNILEGIEKENEERAAAMDEEVEYQRAVLDQKKEDRRLYNEEIKILMQQDKETIMATWKALDTEWQTATDTNRILMEDNMSKLVANGQASATLLADTEIQKIEDAFLDVKEAGIDEIDDATSEYANKVASISPGVVGNIDTIENAYIGVEGVVDRIIKKQGELLSAERLNELRKIAFNTDVPDIPPGQEQGFNKGHQGKITKVINNGGGEKLYEIDGSGQYYSASQLGITDAQAAVGKGVTIGSENAAHVKSDIAWVSEKILKDRACWNRAYVTKDGKTFSHKDVKGNIPNEGFSISGYIDEVTGTDSSVSGARLYATTLHDKNGRRLWISQSNLNQLLGFPADKQLFELYNMTKYSKGYYPQYKTGGMVDFTGPAWVDGTKSRPEAFLSANDTQLIASLRDVLRAGISPTAFAARALQKSGDTYYTIHINVDELGDGYSVDDLVEEMEQRILEATGNSNVVKLT
jgi:hypothetical protein